MKEGHSSKRAGVRAPVRPVHVGVAAPEQKKVEALKPGPKKEVKTEEVIPMGAPKPKSDEAIPMGAPKPKADEAIPLGAPAPKSDEAIPLGSPSTETGEKEREGQVLKTSIDRSNRYLRALPKAPEAHYS